MIKAEYKPETEELVITLGDFPNEPSMTEVVDFKEFMNGIPTERARIECVLSEIKKVKMNRITKIDEFIKTIQKIMLKQVEVRNSMEDQAERGNHKGVKSLSLVHKALLDEKNTLREIRYAIKLLENDEGRLMVALMELSA